MAKKRVGRRSKSTGEKIAAKLVKPAGPGAIYIGPWMLFRRVAGADDTKHAIGWIRESIAEAVDAELATANHTRDNPPMQRTATASSAAVKSSRRGRRGGR